MSFRDIRDAKRSCVIAPTTSCINSVYLHVRNAVRDNKGKKSLSGSGYSVQNEDIDEFPQQFLKAPVSFVNSNERSHELISTHPIVPVSNELAVINEENERLEGTLG